MQTKTNISKTKAKSLYLALLIAFSGSSVITLSSCTESEVLGIGNVPRQEIKEPYRNHNHRDDVLQWEELQKEVESDIRQEPCVSAPASGDGVRPNVPPAAPLAVREYDAVQVADYFDV
jgi:hypothetical protein